MQEKSLLTKTATVSRTKSALVVAFAVLSVGGIALAGMFGWMSRGGYQFTCKQVGSGQWCSFQRVNSATGTVGTNNSQARSQSVLRSGSQLTGNCDTLVCPNGQNKSLANKLARDYSGNYSATCMCGGNCPVPSCSEEYKFEGNSGGCPRYSCITRAQYIADSCNNAENMTCPTGTVKTSRGTSNDGSGCPAYECAPINADGTVAGPYVVTGPDKNPMPSYTLFVNWGETGRNRSDYNSSCPPLPSCGGKTLSAVTPIPGQTGAYCATYTCSDATVPNAAGNSSASGGCTGVTPHYDDGTPYTCIGGEWK